MVFCGGSRLGLICQTTDLPSLFFSYFSHSLFPLFSVIHCDKKRKKKKKEDDAEAEDWIGSFSRLYFPNSESVQLKMAYFSVVQFSHYVYGIAGEGWINLFCLGNRPAPILLLYTVNKQNYFWDCITILTGDFRTLIALSVIRHIVALCPT